MEEDSVFNKFKNAFKEDPPKPKVVNRDLDPDKAKAFEKGFNGGSKDEGANARRLKQLKNSNY